MAGGYPIAYRIAGDGPPLVLLHGFLCDSRVWRTQLDGLADAFTVVAWDAPGAGSSSDPSDRFMLADWSECLARFLDALRLEPAHVLGLSWGGMLAQDLYRLDPDRIASLTLANTHAGWRGSLPAEAVEQRLERCIRESVLPADEFVGRWVPEFLTDAAPQELRNEMAAVVGDFHPLGFRLMARSLAETDTRELLRRVSAPTLLLWGEQDLRSPLSIAMQLRDAIPHAELAVIENAGHVSNMEQPGAFNANVRDFVTRAL